MGMLSGSIHFYSEGAGVGYISWGEVISGEGIEDSIGEFMEGGIIFIFFLWVMVEHFMLFHSGNLLMIKALSHLLFGKAESVGD